MKCRILHESKNRMRVHLFRKYMTFDEADNGNANPHYAVHSAASANCLACVLSMKARLEGGVMYKQDHMMKKAT